MVMWSNLTEDLRFVLRVLARRPLYAGTAVLTLGLALGMNAAMFAVADAVLLAPLPFRNPEELVIVGERHAEKGYDQLLAAPAKFVTWREEASSFADWAASASTRLDLTGGDEPLDVAVHRVTPGYFGLLGVELQAGRGFLPDEGRPGEGRVAIVSDRLWRTALGSTTDLKQSRLILGGETYAVVGVAPPGLDVLGRIDVWMPLALPSWDSRVARFLTVFGRLRPGVSTEQAAAELDGLAARLATAFPATDAGWSVRLVPLRQRILGDAQLALVVLSCAVLVVLAIACINLASLVLARTMARGREIALRLALGAGRRAVGRLLISEVLTLALIAAVGGLLLASWGLDLVLAGVPVDLPRIDKAGVGARAAALTLSLGLACGLTIGSACAVLWRRPLPAAMLKEAHAVGLSQGGHRLLRHAIAVEVALALVLLIGAALLLESFVRLRRVEPGFRVRGVLTVPLSLPRWRYPSSRSWAELYGQAQAQLASLPGVRAAGVVSHLPLDGSSAPFRFLIEGEPERSTAELPMAEYRVAGGGFFHAMGIEILELDPSTNPDDPTRGGIVVSREMQRRFWPGETVLGKRISVDGPEGPWRPIVGVVADVRHFGLGSEPRPTFYAGLDADPWPAMTLVVRSDGDDVPGLASAVRTRLQALDPQLPIARIVPLADLVASSLARPRFNLAMLALFAIVAAFQAMVGLYGVLAYGVELRLPELAVRMSLGADRRSIVLLVVRQALAIAATGVALGILLALGLTRFLRGLLYGVQATDPRLFALVSLLLLCAAALAGLLPAKRAGRLDPAATLRA